MLYPSKDQLERAKLTLEMIKYICIVGLIVIVVLQLDYLADKAGGLLKKAGMRVEEFSAFGFKLKATTETLSAAGSEIKTFRELLLCKHAQKCNEAQTAEIARIVQEAGPTNQLTKIEQTINAVIKETEQFVDATEQQTAAKSPAPGQGGGKWIALTGSDKTLAAAQQEVRRLVSAFPNTVVLLASNRYRTVVSFDTEAEAKSKLDAIEGITGRRPYVRNFGTWCPGAAQETGFIRCGTG